MVGCVQLFDELLDTNSVGGLLQVHSLMMIQYLRLGVIEYFFGMDRIIRGAMDDKDKLAGLDRLLILQYTVLGNAQAV